MPNRARPLRPAPDDVPDAGEGAPGAPDDAPAAPDSAPGAPDDAPGAPDDAPGAGDNPPASCDNPPAAGEGVPGARDDARGAPDDAENAQARAARVGLTRAAIVRAAIEIADADGLDAVSIRHVADRLSARPMSLYTYIASKEDLLALMAEEVVGEVLVREPLPSDDWRGALRAIASRSHEAFVAHPWVLEISGRRPNLGHNALHHAEQLLAAIAPLGLEHKDAWAAVYAVNDYTLGHALRVAGANKEPDLGFPDFDAAAFPRLRRALGDGGFEARGPQTFEHGLELVLDGIERRFAP